MRQFTNSVQVNLAEDAITALSAGEDGSIMISVSGHEIVSIMFSD
jgi:hypothetical protein